ncbi:MAG: hypothetical protein NTX75_07845 [Proteobacteria bacterium]|nr:hypothetical protein [Pseudomonadota bacterium]
MPLLFKSLNHGEIPFGFFNIETDMILLNNYFFFASDFTGHIIEMAGKKPNEPSDMTWGTYILEEKDIGNLMAAISGVYFSGFIGEVYGHFPFPHEPEKFKQNPEGYKTRELIDGIIKRYASLTKIPVIVTLSSREIKIGEYIFSRVGFHELLAYLWVGGYPRWKDGIRPDYILKMKESVMRSTHHLFEGIRLE